MPTIYTKRDFKNSEEGIATLKALRSILADDTYITETSYTTNGEIYPDHVMPFLDKHMNYLQNHPAVNPQYYLSNLRLMLKVRK
jgi:hypothetical protein